MKKTGGGDLDNDTHPRKMDAVPTLYESGWAKQTR